MPFSDRLARFNRIVANPILGTVAPYVPPMALVIHLGRRSGRRYSTPVLAFSADGGIAIALFYGSRTDWVRNVQAANGCVLRRGGRTLQLTSPVILGGDGLRLLPRVIRPALGAMGVTGVLTLQRLDT
jgi:deazaflavin-dependent oxidoreductase (nitroreductase family)